MNPRPPPIDATSFLNDRQLRELHRIPAPYRLMGAWLIIIRDDYLGEWRERSSPCGECVAQRLPCINKTNSGSRQQCESCFLAGYACGTDLGTSDIAEQVGPRHIATSAKRKLESGLATPPPKTPRRSESVIELTLDKDSQKQFPELMDAAPGPSGDRPVIPDVRARVPSTETRRSTRGRSESSRHRNPESARRRIDDMRPTESARTGKALLESAILGSRDFDLRSSRHASHLEANAVAIHPIPPKPPTSLVQPPGPFNGHARMRAVLEKARSLSRSAVNVVVEDGVDVTDFQRYDFTVIVRSPGKLSSWLVVFVDHARREGRALFSDRQMAREQGGSVERNLKRAFDICHKSITLEAEIYPCLDRDVKGDLYATALAVEFLMNGPGIPIRELLVDRAQARKEHDQLLAGSHISSSAVTPGRRSRPVAIFSRHERVFEWLTPRH